MSVCVLNVHKKEQVLTEKTHAFEIVCLYIVVRSFDKPVPLVQVNENVEM